MLNYNVKIIGCTLDVPAEIAQKPASDFGSPETAPNRPLNP